MSGINKAMNVIDEGANSLGQNRSQREILLSMYRPLAYLRPEQKKLLKTVWSLDQGLDGTRLGCEYCKVVMDFSQITVHHRDGEESHNELPNLAPACWEDNRKEGWMVRRRKAAQASKSERENLSAGIGSESDEQKPTVVQLNEDYEPEVRLFVIEHISKFGLDPGEKAIPFLNPKVVRDAAAEWSGANPKTCYPYFGKMLNPINGFVKVEKKFGKKYLTFRHADHFKLTPNELMEMFPKAGRRTRKA